MCGDVAEGAQMMDVLNPFITEGARAMVFVDGENLAIRYGAMATGGAATPWYEPSIPVWHQDLNPGLILEPFASNSNPCLFPTSRCLRVPASGSPPRYGVRSDSWG